ncbi:MAG: class I SAM-dependent methyltransferase [Actinobacteria bacterium]|nr:class I SAM-dependent methyltransferase [Actinomycetota bacterium]
MSSGDGPAAVRWRRLVADRLAELERLSPAAGSVSGSFWDSRAGRYAAAVRRADTERDPFLRRLRRLTDASSAVIDVGAGTGRFALALADGVGHVTAVEPSSPMLAILQRGAQELGFANVTALQATWDEARVEPADVAFSAFVLTLVPDAVPFLAKLDATARNHALLYLGAYSGDAVLDPLWRHFHGAPRVPGPSYLDAVAVLRELGVEHRVTVVEIPDHRRWVTVEDAVESYRDALLLDDTAQVRAQLADLLASWLLGRRGAYRSPLRVVPAAIVDWRGGQLAGR